jgi:hypothetical protein
MKRNPMIHGGAVGGNHVKRAADAVQRKHDTAETLGEAAEMQ